jgi:aminoglycoside phosphotransferase (APT) family kinase protein
VAQIINPPQGMTSETAILLGATGRFLVKHSRPQQYHDWLRYEAMVLEALKGANLPVPELFAFHEGDSAWMLTSVLSGEPMSAVFMKTQDSNFRQKLLHNLGKILAQIHRSPPPATMNLKAVDWLDAMLEKAEKICGYLMSMRTCYDQSKVADPKAGSPY